VILLPNVALKHSGSYFHSKLEWASEAMIANATYFGNAQWAQEYLDYCHRDSHFKSRWLAAGGDRTGKVVIVWVYRAARYRGRREMEIPARQYVVGTPAIGARQRAVVDVRGQAPWRLVIGRGVTCRGKKPTRRPKQPFEAFAPPVRGANQSGLWSG